MKNLKLTRPLAFFDLETTGIDAGSDRIVEICILKVFPDGRRESLVERLNPERPIPAEASAVHGIYDHDVRDCPGFRERAATYLGMLEGADLSGYNVQRFDIPLIRREFRDIGTDLPMDGVRVVDAMTIYHRKERRDLSAAVRFFLGKELEGAHSAEEDVAATAEVLDAQLARYDDLPDTVEDLAAWCNPVREDAVDRSGKFVWKKKEIVFTFGKYRDQTLASVRDSNRGYLEWVLRSDFPDDSKVVVQAALDGRLPDPPKG
ncbi:MAG: 3'-5' exonuclease [Acidobacteria bacterium]|uniref:3'-5' exonuclease n=1 Tax=Candidatus Polarisedimenticola svalbardensis TaxID=2886004 RepID=A0A8J6XY25_9BACT|nr:3'-5' exonuclease [Candidatus Polarisedimenticola svalbardensis]